ncbi:SGNH/GDSL hydrolase family protein [Paenibacillus cymbidii]|uniref:SGNH/GDSL hydrolase family protein n=1 Tax=Paenibacillus cymbidii TaxID=1639034 RepID=UPI0010808580|nr:SGNH/GDSL hydrolase family protein [Paenibacillus cymbidii]
MSVLNTIDKLKNGERAFIVCIGDSITEQNYHLRGKLNYVGQFAEKLIDTYGRKFMLLNAGVSGDTTWGVLDRLERDALRFRPDLVTVMLGMNDSTRGEAQVAAYRRNLEEIVGRIKAAGGEALLLTQNPLDFNVHEGAVASRASYPLYAQACREAAMATGTPLCDIYERWNEETGGATNQHLMLMDDSIHPGERGHTLMAGVLIEFLGIR